METTTEKQIILRLGFVWKQQRSIISSAYLQQWGGYCHTGHIYCMKTVVNLFRGPPGISDWSHAVISKSLLNAAGPDSPHLSSKIMVCLACCPTPEIKSQLDRTALYLTITMTKTWSSQYWSADRPWDLCGAHFLFYNTSFWHTHTLLTVQYILDIN